MVEKIKDQPAQVKSKTVKNIWLEPAGGVYILPTMGYKGSIKISKYRSMPNEELDP
jgi:hypothetical protein